MTAGGGGACALTRRCNAAKANTLYLSSIVEGAHSDRLGSEEERRKEGLNPVESAEDKSINATGIELLTPLFGPRTSEVRKFHPMILSGRVRDCE